MNYGLILSISIDVFHVLTLDMNAFIMEKKFAHKHKEFIQMLIY